MSEAAAKSLDPSEALSQAPIQRSPSWKAVLVLVVVLGLVVTNMLSLVHDGFHQAVYGVVAAALKILPGGIEVLAGSPTEVWKRNVDKEAAALKTSNQDLQSKVLLLAAANAALVIERATLTDRIAKSTAAVQRVSGRIGPRYVKNAAKNIAELPAGSIPIAGIVANVAMVAIDVNDACDTLRDLHDLNVEHGLAPLNPNAVCGLPVPTPAEIEKKVRNEIDQWWRLVLSWARN